MATKDNLLTVTQIASALKVREETVRRYIREKKLKADKKRVQGVKKQWLISPEELKRFQDE